MPRMTLRAKDQLTLLDKIRKATHLVEDDILEAELTDEGILLRPKKLVDASQEWFWSTEWQDGERKADEDLVNSKMEVFGSKDEFLDALQRGAK